MSEVCGYEYDDEDYPFEAKCELEKGHRGHHRFTQLLDWDTKPIDVCRAEGHLWGEWRVYESPYRRDISDVLIATLLPHGGHLETIKEPTKMRDCGHCGSRETDGESRWVGMAPMPIFSSMDLGKAPDGTKLTWTEDRLNG